MKQKNDLSLRDNIAILTAVLATSASILGISAAISHYYNRFQNNYEIITESHKTISRTNGLFGHIEFTEFADRSYEVKVYPSLGHRIISSELDQDFNGDNLVDRIRINRSSFYANKLHKLLVRKTDYNENQELFNQADERLHKLIQKYGRQSDR